MTNETLERKMVRLREVAGKLVIDANREPVGESQALKNIVRVRYAGPDFRSTDGKDIGERAIYDAAPPEANAYKLFALRTEKIVMCGDTTAFVQYFSINRKQFDSYARGVAFAKPSVEPSEIPDGEAD